MATFEVTIEPITVFPHPNAERLELARVGLYNVVVVKGQYKTGDNVLYIPEYAVLPENLIIALGLEGKLSGTHKNRVKPIKLRGETSQGLVAPLTVLTDGASELITDYAPTLGITKYEPVVPSHMAGDAHGNINLVNWIDIENIKKFPDIFPDGTEVHISEKIHGTASLFSFIFPDDDYLMSENMEILASSKGLGAKKLVLNESESNVYWRALKQYDVETLARNLADAFSISVDPANGYMYDTELGSKVKFPDGSIAPVITVAIFGETFGSKVQDLHYGSIGTLGFSVFDAYVEFANGHGFWVNPEKLEELANESGVPVVPTLYVGPYSLDVVIEHAYGKETISGNELHIREGVVVRPTTRIDGYSEGAKQIAKYVSDDYLLRKGETTEYN